MLFSLFLLFWLALCVCVRTIAICVDMCMWFNIAIFLRIQWKWVYISCFQFPFVMKLVIVWIESKLSSKAIDVHCGMKLTDNPNSHGHCAIIEDYSRMEIEKNYYNWPKSPKISSKIQTYEILSDGSLCISLVANIQNSDNLFVMRMSNWKPSKHIYI